MAWLDSNVNIPPHRQRLHRCATRDQMLVAPAEVSEELIVEANLTLLRGARGVGDGEAGR